MQEAVSLYVGVVWIRQPKELQMKSLLGLLLVMRWSGVGMTLPSKRMVRVRWTELALKRLAFQSLVDLKGVTKLKRLFFKVTPGHRCGVSEIAKGTTQLQGVALVTGPPAAGAGPGASGGGGVNLSCHHGLNC